MHGLGKIKLRQAPASLPFLTRAGPSMLDAATQPIHTSPERARRPACPAGGGASGGGRHLHPPPRRAPSRRATSSRLSRRVAGAGRCSKSTTCSRRAYRSTLCWPASAPRPAPILHYDIAYIHRFALGSYERDPASELFGQVGRLDTVLVKTDVDRLTRQHRERHQAQVASKNRAELLGALGFDNLYASFISGCRAIPPSIRRRSIIRQIFLGLLRVVGDLRPQSGAIQAGVEHADRRARRR